MKVQNIVDELEHVEERYIDEADPTKQTKNKKGTVLRIALIAAAALLVAGGVLLGVFLARGGEENPGVLPTSETTAAEQTPAGSTPTEPPITEPPTTEPQTTEPSTTEQTPTASPTTEPPTTASPVEPTGTPTPIPVEYEHPPVYVTQHTHKWVYEAEVPATCTQAGRKGGCYCAVCSEVLYETMEYPALGGEHVYENGVCTRCGALKPSEGFRFALDEEKQEYHITSGTEVTDYLVVFPEEYDGLPVTAIDDDAFGNLPETEHDFVLNDSIRYIGKNAFRNRQLHVPKVYIHDLLSWCAINEGEYALEVGFSREGTYNQAEIAQFFAPIGVELYLNGELVTDAVLPMQTKLIGRHSFFNNKNLKSVAMPSFITGIADYAFYGCSAMTEFAFSWQINEIGIGAFSESGIRNIVMPDHVEVIKGGTFFNCRKLQTIILPYSLKEIGLCAFMNCTQLSGLILPTGLQTIGESAFQDCAAIETLEIADLAAYLSTDYVGEYANPLRYARTLTLDGKALAEIVIPETVTKIKDYALYGCNAQRIVLHDGITRIGQRAFLLCSSITGIDLPEALLSVGDEAFRDCKALVSVVVPENCALGQGAFRNCTALTSARVACDVPANCFSGCTALAAAELSPAVTEIGAYGFGGCTKLTSVVFEDGRTDLLFIGDNAFGGCSSLAEIRIPDGSSIGTKCFDGCKRLTDVYIGENVLTMENWNAGCAATIHYPEDYVEDEAFYYTLNYDRISVTAHVKESYQGDDLILPDYYCGYPVTYMEITTKRKGFGHLHLPAHLRFKDAIGGDYYILGNAHFESLSVSEDNPYYYVKGNCLIDRRGRLLLGCADSVIPLDGSVTNIVNIAFRPKRTEPLYLSKIIGTTDWLSSKGGIYVNFSQEDRLTGWKIASGVKVYYDTQFYLVNGLPVLGTCEEMLFEENGDGGYTLLYVRDHEGKDVLIPAEYNGKPVTAIASSVLVKGSYGKLYIPASVTSISEDSFARCTFESVEVDAANERYAFVGGCLIDTKEKTLLLGTNKTEIPFDGSVTKIGRFAFCSIEIPEKLLIPACIEKIGTFAFANVNNGRIYLPYSDDEMPDGWRKGLVPQEVGRICPGVKFDVKDGKLVIADDATALYFVYDKEHDTIHFRGVEKAYEYIRVPKIVLGKRVTQIEPDTFDETEKKTALKEVYLPEGFETIYYRAFEDCVNLRIIHLPATLAEIYENAFNGCTALDTIVLPEGVDRLAPALHEHSFTGTAVELRDYFLYEYDWERLKTSVDND